MKKALIKIKEFIDKITIKIGAQKLHVICSFVITLVIGIIFGIIPGIVVGCIAGLGKEIFDELIYRKESLGVGFDKEDLVYDSAGILIAAIILCVL